MQTQKFIRYARHARRNLSTVARQASEPLWQWKHLGLLVATAGGVYVAEKHGNFHPIAFCSAERISKEKFVKLKTDQHTKYYDIGKLLGKGAFGEVRQVTHKTYGKVRAAKYLCTKGMSQQEVNDIFDEI